MDKDKDQKLLIPYNPDAKPLSITKDRVLNKSIIDNLDSDVIVLDKDLNIVLMNKAAEKNWGVRFKDVKGVSYLSLKLRSIEKNLAHNLAEVVKSKKTISIKELQFISPDNITRFLDLSCMPIFDEHGQVQGALSVSKDVTKRVLSDIQYRETQRIVQRLTSELGDREKEIKRLQSNLEQRYSFHNLIGKNYQMRNIYSLIERVAQTDSTILITGETGTGKELVARAIHYGSSRADRNLITVNCAALPEALLESELFGHVKGSFTGAVRDRKGKFELADKGTLFLDEIGELSIPIQVKLLRALQEKEIDRVGDEKKIKVDIRIVAATNRDLLELIEDGKFRKDLYYRLNIISVKLPPLRERIDDIPILVNHFIEKFNKQFKKKVSGVSQYALKRLISYKWPGNIRELEAVIEKAALLEESDIIQDVDVSPHSSGSSGLFLPVSASEQQLSSYADMMAYFNSYERDYFISVFKRFNGRIGEIARFTGLNRRSILNKMKKFNIKKADFR